MSSDISPSMACVNRGKVVCVVCVILEVGRGVSKVDMSARLCI